MIIIIIMIINIIREERTRSYLRNNQYKKMKEHNCHYFNQANKTKPSQKENNQKRTKKSKRAQCDYMHHHHLIWMGLDWME